MIDGNLCVSESLNQVSPLAELVFVHLLTLADSSGRFSGNPRILLGGAFPLREDVTLEALMECLAELEDVDCLHRYEVDAKLYYHYPNWTRYQKLRRTPESRFPDPAENCGACRTGVGPVRNHAPTSSGPCLHSDETLSGARRDHVGTRTGPAPETTDVGCRTMSESSPVEKKRREVCAKIPTLYLYLNIRSNLSHVYVPLLTAFRFRSFCFDTPGMVYEYVNVAFT